jgi:hypothetical protein
VYDIPIDGNINDTNKQSLIDNMKARDALATERMRAFYGFIWLRKIAKTDKAGQEHLLVELVQLVPFQENEKTLEKISAEFRNLQKEEETSAMYQNKLRQ